MTTGERTAVFDTIRGKRDTRAYAGRPIPEETLHRILQAGRMAGSAKHAEPCRFVLLRDRARREEVGACGNFTAQLPAAAIAVAIVTLPPSGQWDAERAMSFDAGRAAQNMMLAAWAEGISSCPVTMHHHDDAARVLGLPEGHRCTWVLAFGYPADDAPPREQRQKLSLSEYIHEGRW
ncbi:MAG TPA: nitroreductase family protein [Dehalococcoidia bacterium]|nr:nitroreductase family protein [Dehalococcoidia bacterium]